jgi:hypothetical protein
MCLYAAPPPPSHRPPFNAVFRYFVSNWGDEMTIGFTAMQFIAGNGSTIGMGGAKIEINGKAAPPQLLRCLDPPTNVNERDLPVKFCLPYDRLALLQHCRRVLIPPTSAATASATALELYTASTSTGGVRWRSASCSCGISTARAT